MTDTKTELQECTCIGCGCTDNNACQDDNCQPCRWLRVDRLTNRGVCSECSEFVPEWNKQLTEPRP